MKKYRIKNKSKKKLFNFDSLKLMLKVKANKCMYQNNGIGKM